MHKVLRSHLHLRRAVGYPVSSQEMLALGAGCLWTPAQGFRFGLASNRNFWRFLSDLILEGRWDWASGRGSDGAYSFFFVFECGLNCHPSGPLGRLDAQKMDSETRLCVSRIRVTAKLPGAWPCMCQASQAALLGLTAPCPGSHPGEEQRSTGCWVLEEPGVICPYW
jgi:hypothetical protein